MSAANVHRSTVSTISESPPSSSFVSVGRLPVDGQARIIESQPTIVRGQHHVNSNTANDAIVVERLEREIAFTESVVSPEKSCEQVCVYLKQVDDPLLKPLPDNSQWNRNTAYDTNQACCTMS